MSSHGSAASIHKSDMSTLSQSTNNTEVLSVVSEPSDGAGALIEEPEVRVGEFTVECLETVASDNVLAGVDHGELLVALET